MVVKGISAKASAIAERSFAQTVSNESYSLGAPIFLREFNLKTEVFLNSSNFTAILK